MKVNGRKSNIKALMGRLVQHHATWFTIHYQREGEREREIENWMQSTKHKHKIILNMISNTLKSFTSVRYL